jgi:hypothetical protein
MSKLGVVALIMLSMGAMAASAWAAAPTPISGCPYTITAPGNYILAKNLTSAGTCIAIQAANVAIDLQGHTITGSGTGLGITATQVDNLVIANGTVQNFSLAILVNLSRSVTISGMTIQKNREPNDRAI